MWSQRNREILLKSNVFKCLTKADQEKMLKFNAVDGMAICVAKCEQLTPQDMLTFCQGLMDDEEYTKNYSSVRKYLTLIQF